MDHRDEKTGSDGRMQNVPGNTGKDYRDYLRRYALRAG